MGVFFSVILPLYNKEKDIANTINSVLAQSHLNFEIIIVNDGSTDNSRQVVEQFKDDRIVLYDKLNGGASSARNYGVQKSNAEYIAFLDGDDYWYSEHLETLDEMIKKIPQAKWFATAYEVKHNKHLILTMKSPVIDFGLNWIGEIDDFFANSMIDCLAWTSSVCMRKDFFNELGGFNLKYDTGQDMDLWIRAALSSELCFCNKVTSRYELMASNRLTNKPTKLKQHLNVQSFAEIEKNNISLKRFMDRIRFAYALKFKLAGITSMYVECKNAIDMSNLTFSQRFLLRTSTVLLNAFIKIKSSLENGGIRLRIPTKLKI